MEEEKTTPTFAELGVCETICSAVEYLNYLKPTPIQVKAIPEVLLGKDIIGLAETGSGKTAAFLVPILQNLLENPISFAACIVTPTRELALQIGEHLDALGSNTGVKHVVLVGNIDIVTQAISLARRPHVVIATPGRLIDHLENTKGFNLRALEFLVLDEADKLLQRDFEREIDTLLKIIPKKRHTYMFSATMTSKVEKLQKLSLTNPVKIQVDRKYKTVNTLIQKYLFFPEVYKNCYLTFILNEFVGNSFLVFCSTCSTVQRLGILLHSLGFDCTALHGQLSQPKRLAALNKFKAGSKKVLIATDVASRGLDLPFVDYVMNFDIPNSSKDYIHRVGRTARAGKAGKAITFVTQYDIDLFVKIEEAIGIKLEKFEISVEEVMLLKDRVAEANRLANNELKELESRKMTYRSGNSAFDDFITVKVARNRQQKRKFSRKAQRR